MKVLSNCKAYIIFTNKHIHNLSLNITAKWQLIKLYHIMSFQITLTIILIYSKLIFASSSFEPNYGGLSLSEQEKLYEISTKECPGGIFFPKPINETAILCYHGM